MDTRRAAGRTDDLRRFLLIATMSTTITFSFSLRAANAYRYQRPRATIKDEYNDSLHF